MTRFRVACIFLVCIIQKSVLSAVWVSQGRWDDSSEKAYQTYVETSVGTDFCTLRQMYSYCSGTAYQIRAQFAYQSKLPFRYFDQKQGQFVSNLTTQFDHISNPDERALAFIQSLTKRYLVHSSSIHKDSYAIKPEELLPGDLLVSEGHIMMVKKIYDFGLFEVTYTSEKNEVQTLYQHFYILNGKSLHDCPTQIQCGLRRFLPKTNESVEQNFEVTWNDYLNDSGKGKFYLWLAKKLKPNSVFDLKNFEEVYQVTMREAYVYLKDRLAITLAYHQLQTKSNGFNPGPEEKAIYTTHSRDDRLTWQFEALLDLAETYGFTHELFTMLKQQPDLKIPLADGSAVVAIDFPTLFFFVYAQFAKELDPFTIAFGDSKTCPKSIVPGSFYSGLAAHEKRWPLALVGGQWSTLNAFKYRDCAEFLRINLDDLISR